MTRLKKPKRLQCDSCDDLYQLRERSLDGFTYELYVCPKCGDTLFTLEQAKVYREAHTLAELAKKQMQPLILRQVGNSVNATVPKEFAAIGFRQGRRFLWELEGPDAIRLRLLADAAPSSAAEPARPKRASSPSARVPAPTKRRKSRHSVKLQPA